MRGFHHPQYPTLRVAIELTYQVLRGEGAPKYH